MSSFPGSPKVMKGAIIGLDPFNPLASVIIFQYNANTPRPKGPRIEIKPNAEVETMKGRNP